jgi:hypothetical protein
LHAVCEERWGTKNAVWDILFYWNIDFNPLFYLCDRIFGF